MAFVTVGYGILAIVAFVFWETRARSPLLNPRLFTAGLSFALSSLSTFLNYASTFSVSYLMSIYLQGAKGLGSDVAGLIMITAPVVQAVFSVITGRLSDHFSPFKLASIGGGFCAASLISFATITPETSMGRIIFGLILIGIGYGFFGSPNVNAAMSVVPRSDAGIANAFISTMRSLGQVTSLSVIAVVTSVLLGSQPINQVAPVDLTAVMRTCYMISSVICLSSVFTSLWNKKRPLASESLAPETDTGSQ
jgi:MFS family permease